MNVLIVITRGDSIGGAQLYVRDLAARLQRDHHDVLVMTGTRGALTTMLTAAGVATMVCRSLRRRIDPLNDARAVRAIGHVISTFQPDLVSVHSSKAGVLGRLAAKRHGVPCVFTAHGWAFAAGVPQPGRALWRIIERHMEPITSRIICVSQADHNLAREAGFAPARLAMIHNGIEDTVAPCVQRDPVAPVRIVMVARFCAQKDHRSLLAAIQTIPHCTLDFVGDGPLQGAMKEVADALGVRGRVRFHGYRADVSAVLAAADLFVLASHYEGFPLTTLEAMRAGLPVIVTDAGGAGEAVRNGVTGYIVPRGDIERLRDRIRVLVDHPELRAAMGQAGRKRYLSAFTFDRMYDATLAVYQETTRGLAPRDTAALGGAGPAPPPNRHPHVTPVGHVVAVARRAASSPAGMAARGAALTRRYHHKARRSSWD